ncbi:hypothetical protein Tco_0701966 [Tanacetum coccineum]|uniref:Reverse transcriptase domain-containing protein n=1 Tax=Tanacetum coccineum TaxID=301880 RepID=A0ABQ4XVQ8_9ASTR
MVSATALLIGFNGEIIWPIGQISLSVKIFDTEYSTYTQMNFVVVRSPSPYNGIIGRPGVRKIQAVPSTAHGMTGSIAFRQQPSRGGKNQSGNSFRVPRANTSNRFHSNGRGAKEVVQLT